MKKRPARELLDFTFDELENAINEKSGELAKEETNSQENNIKKKNRKILDNERCIGTPVSTDEDVR